MRFPELPTPDPDDLIPPLHIFVAVDGKKTQGNYSANFTTVLLSTHGRNGRQLVRLCHN